MLNKVILIGRLTNDIEIRYSNDQIPYCYFTLAVGRQGSKDKTDFISCVAFRATAELMSRYLGKGSLISTEGRLEVYQTQKDGDYQTRTNVVVNNIVFLDSRKSNNQNQQNNYFETEKETSSKSNNSPFTNESKKPETSSNEEFDFENFEIKI